MKNSIFSIVLSLALLFVFTNMSAFALNKGDAKVTEKAKATFAKLYPNVKEVKWVEVSKSEFKAEFKKDNKAMAAFIGAEGDLIKTKTEISKSELPKGVEEFVAKNHKDWAIAKTAKIVDAKGVVTFETQIIKEQKKENLMFTKDGKYIEQKL